MNFGNGTGKIFRFDPDGITDHFPATPSFRGVSSSRPFGVWPVRPGRSRNSGSGRLYLPAFTIIV